MSELTDVVIVGGGPAGLSAALLLGRARRNVVLCDDGRQRNAHARAMHGFISREGISAGEFLRIARDELRAYDTIAVRSASVTHVRGTVGAFTLGLDDGTEVHARRVLLACGVTDAVAAIEGLEECWGCSAFVCPYCVDGWEIRDRTIAIAGEGDLVGLAQELYQWTHAIALCGVQSERLDDAARIWIAQSGVRLFDLAPVRLRHDDGKIAAILLQDGTQVACEALFMCAPLRERSTLFDGLGCVATDDGFVEIDRAHQTSVRGVYAAGDNVAHVHQVIVAAASGTKAAIAINDDLLRDDVSSLLTGATKFI